MFSINGQGGGQIGSLINNAQEGTNLYGSLAAQTWDPLLQNQAGVLQANHPMAAANQKGPPGLAGAPIPSMMGGMGTMMNLMQMQPRQPPPPPDPYGGFSGGVGV